MLDELVPNQYKLSNMPALIGWNATMSIQFILNQSEDAYGKPSVAVLFANDTLFKSSFAATKAPELLFLPHGAMPGDHDLGQAAVHPGAGDCNCTPFVDGFPDFSESRIQIMGDHGRQDVPGPQNVHPRGVLLLA